MSIGYSLKIENDMAKAFGRDLPISEKASIEISNYIRGNTLVIARKKLQNAIDKKQPIPFKKYTNGLGHKKGNLTSGRFPIKACTAILKLLNSAESNALFKGLNSKSLVVFHISVKNSASTWRYGRQSRRRMKKCHVEIVLKEIQKASSSKSKSKTNIKPKDDSVTQKISKEPAIDDKKVIKDLKNSDQKIAVDQPTDKVKKPENKNKPEEK
ncbi:MAG: 50S ribosomal protein L22 [Candidatus Woesearchaeota archaeon]